MNYANRNYFAFCLNLYEHQSTFNPNLPLRDLFYVADLLQKIVKDENLYSSSLIKIPTPRFVVFYNGTDWKEEQTILRLSDAFLHPMDVPELELQVTVYNINTGKNPALLAQCQPLREYMTFVEKVRTYATSESIEVAVTRAVEECISEGILKDYLLNHKAEAIAMSIYEYDEEKHMKAERKEHYEIGLQEGLQKGIAILTETYCEMGMSREEAAKKAAEKFQHTNSAKSPD